MSTEIKTTAEKASERTKRLIKEKAEAERKQREDDLAEHRASMDAEGEARALVLGKAMKGLSEDEQKLVRLHAAVIVATRDGGTPNQKQAAHDDVALTLAKYMADGVV